MSDINGTLDLQELEEYASTYGWLLTLFPQDKKARQSKRILKKSTLLRF
jgi:hypothetical protein